MSIFGSIKDAIFGHKAVQEAAPAPQAAPQAAPAPAAHPTAAAPAPKKEIDPETALEKIAASQGNPDLNWRTSIVDLMKLIGMDSSLDNRKTLATELGYTGEKNGSAEMNLWLHEKVMDKIRNG
jgi:3-oxoacyl-ACP reductase-like protein